MQKRKIDIRKIIVLILLIGALGYIITSTYSKYITDLGDLAKFGISGWNIRVNGQRIATYGAVKENPPITMDSDDVDPNYIAPGATGYTDVIIEYDGTEVPFSYSYQLTDPTVDYNSTYDVEGTGADWDDNAGNYYKTYRFKFHYNQLSTPVFYYLNTGEKWTFNGEKYEQNSNATIPIKITLPPDVEYERVDNVQFDSYENHVLSVSADWYMWHHSTNMPVRLYVDPNDHGKFVEGPTDYYTNYYTDNTVNIVLCIKTTNPDMTNDIVFDKFEANNKVLTKYNFADFQVYGFSVDEEIDKKEIHYIDTSVRNNKYTESSKNVGVYDPKTGYIVQLINSQAYCDYYNNNLKKESDPNLSPTHENDTIRFRLYMIWNDNEANILNDDEDTILGYNSYRSTTTRPFTFNIMFNQEAPIKNVVNGSGSGPGSTDNPGSTPNIPSTNINNYLTVAHTNDIVNGDGNITTSFTISNSSNDPITFSKLNITASGLTSYYYNGTINGGGVKVVNTGNKFTFQGWNVGDKFTIPGKGTMTVTLSNFKSASGVFPSFSYIFEP